MARSELVDHPRVPAFGPPSRVQGFGSFAAPPGSLAGRARRRPRGRRTRDLGPPVVRRRPLTAAALEAASALIAALALAACAGGPPEPAPIVLDEDACAYCRMAISQREFAAELVTRQGRVERFDDVGCMAAWLRAHGRPEGAAAFVVDYRSGEWLPAEDATYVASPALPTPMRSGLAAFADPAAAEALAHDVRGATASWEQVRSGAVGAVETEVRR